MSFSDSGNALANLFVTPLLSSLSKDERVNFEKNCTIRKFALGHNVVEQGDNQNNVFFMLFGTAQVLNYSESGRAITYAVLEKGDMFGEMAAIDGLPRSAWVCTVTPCTVASLSGSDFIELVTSNPKMALAVLRKLSANLRALDKRLADISLLGAEQRVCIELIRMAKPDLENPGSYLIVQMPTQVNFASMVGSSRETVSRIFGKLREDSIISQSSRGLHIICHERLSQRAFT